MSTEGAPEISLWFFQNAEFILEESRRYDAKRKKQKREYELKELRGEVKVGDEFWNEVEEDSPESRIQMHQERQRQKKEEDDRKPMFEKPNYKRNVKFFNSEGDPVNVNQAGLDFALEEEDTNEIVLRLFLPKFLDTELIDVDAQPKYIRVTVKDKSFQIVLRDEVLPDKGKCERLGSVAHYRITVIINRSKLTGEMKIKIPKLFKNKKYEKQKEIERITINENTKNDSKEWIICLYHFYLCFFNDHSFI